MNKSKLVKIIGGMSVIVAGFLFTSGDYSDAPNIAGTTSDLADFYAFEAENPDNTVFAVTLQSGLVEGNVTQIAQFDEDVLIEIKIDNTGDLVEDLVIQAIKRADTMYFFGPSAPLYTGISSEINTENRNQVQISTIEDSYITTTTNGMKFFAGPRRDAFFFDNERFKQISEGTTVPDGFFPQGEATDFFVDKNTLAIVVEVPNSLLGTAPAHIGNDYGLVGLPPAYNVWVTANRKEQ